MNMQYMEIYKDEVYDLLVPNRELVRRALPPKTMPPDHSHQAPKLEVREFEGKVLVPKLSRKRISTEQEFHTIYQYVIRSLLSQKHIEADFESQACIKSAFRWLD